MVLKKKPIIHSFDIKRNKAAYGSALLSLLIGALILIYSAYPYAQDALNKIAGRSAFSKSLLIPSVSRDAVVAGASTISPDNSFSSNYVTNVSRSIASTNKALGLASNSNPDLSKVTGKMKLTIKKLDLNGIPVQINVSSYDEKAYMPILEKNLGHFQGTSLPGHKGNIFIYGHSTNELWAFANPNSAIIAFTKLDKIEIGDEIDLDFEEKTYKYIMQKSRLVSPDDISPIYSTSDQETLTLMTCWPPGIGSQRLIVSATLVS